MIAVGSALLSWPLLLLVVIPGLSLQAFFIWRREKQQQKSTLASLTWNQLRTCVKYLAQASEGANANSVWGILRDLMSSGKFQEQMKRAGTTQTSTLLERQCEEFFQATWTLEKRYNKLGPRDKRVSDSLTELDKVLTLYRRIVHDLLEFLESSDGAEALQYMVPFSNRIFRELADDYDRIMNNLRQVRDRLSAELPPGCLKDDKLRLFPRPAFLA